MANLATLVQGRLSSEPAAFSSSAFDDRIRVKRRFLLSVDGRPPSVLVAAVLPTRGIQTVKILLACH